MLDTGSGREYIDTRTAYNRRFLNLNGVSPDISHFAVDTKATVCLIVCHFSTPKLCYGQFGHFVQSHKLSGISPSNFSPGDRRLHHAFAASKLKKETCVNARTLLTG